MCAVNPQGGRETATKDRDRHTHSHSHTCVSGAVFGEIKAWQKVPGFMLIFIKIILTCNVAAAS